VAEAIQVRQVRIVDEPDEAGRVRRWPDLIRLLFEVLMIVLVVTLGKFGVHTTSGVETDVHNGVELAPSFLLGGITVLMNITTAVIPIGLAVERLLLRDGRRVADAVIAAVLTCGATALLNVWIISAYAPRWLLAELTHRLAAGATTPLHVYIATVVAFLTVIGFNDRPTLRAFTWVCVGIYATAALMSGGSALVGLIVSFLIGRAIAFGWRYTSGVVNNRSTGGAVVAALTRAGVEPVSCRWLGDHGDVRRYEVLCADGRCLEATLLDRDRQGIGAIYRLYRRTRLRGPAQRRNLFSVHRTVEHEALMSYSLADAGINTPKLVAVRELSADAALVAFERVHACALKQIPKEKFTDALLERVFTTVRELGDHQIAHRRLALDSILIDEHGQVWLTELRDGEVAADDLQHLLDIAGTMAALALKAGPERTVRVGARVLGEDLVSAALPLLQPVALTGTTRAALGKSKQLIERLREQISELRPNAPVGEPVRLERLKIRTFLAVTAGCVAVYLLMLEISSADSQSRRSLWQLIDKASPGWLLIAAAAAGLTYVAAAMQLAGFIPERLPKLQNLMVQFSTSFIALFAPAAVGGVTLNVRYLQKRGIAAGPAVSAVGASQVVAFIMHVALIAVFSFFAGSGDTHNEASTLVIAILLAIAVLVMITLAVPPLRRFARRRLAFFEGSLPRLLQVAQSPQKLALALCGTLGISLFNALCLWTCVHTLGDGKQVSYPTIALIYLTVQAVSSISPTPGGIGAIEIGLGGALAAIAGVEKQSAVVAVLVYRLLTAYLPAALGYASLHYLRRKRVV
jgi:uncharacterized protein (TIRG00374 family)